MTKKIFILIGLAALWWLCLYSTYRCYDLKAAFVGYLISCIVAIAVVVSEGEDK